MAASEAVLHQLLDVICNAARDSNLRMADEYAVSMLTLVFTRRPQPR